MLVSKYPISKEEALKYNAKEINITNNSTCDTAYYKVTIKDLVNSSINKDKINYQVIDKSTNTETIDKNPDNFNISDSLTKGNTKTYTIRLWIDESATNTDLFINGDTTKPIEYKYALNIESSDEDMDKEIVSILNIPVGTDGLEKITHEVDDTLQVESDFATEYRYRGGDSKVNNWIYFNCDNLSNQNDSTCEKWRIIGVIPTSDITGKVENRLKIVRNESIGNKNWDSDNAITYNYDRNDDIELLSDKMINGNTNDDVKFMAITPSKGCENCSNNWSRPTALNTYLNGSYYSNLTTNAKSMIGSTKYYLGGNSGTNLTVDTMWQSERKNDANRTGYYYGTNPVVQSDANKKIALMYASDYGYGASKQCNQTLLNYNTNDLCKTTNNWLDKSSTAWVLTHNASYSSNTLYILDSGSLSSNTNDVGNVSNLSGAVYPTLTLASFIAISGGKGTSDSPYQLKIPDNTNFFTINSNSYLYEENMTWQDWVSSPYNTIGVSIKDNYPYTYDNERIGYAGSPSCYNDSIGSVSYKIGVGGKTLCE